MKSPSLLVLPGLLLLIPSPSPAQEAAGRQPSIPGAITQAPDWLTDAPFDLKRFFETPPDSENAAPLYLDALLEFSHLIEPCYPGGARDRGDATEARVERFFKFNLARKRDPNSVSPADADAVAAVYREGFRKLAAAQARPKCVFAIGYDLDPVVPHAQAALMVEGVMEVKTYGDLGRGHLDGAIENAATLLRLSRDLRPRGRFGSQATSILIAEHYVISKILQPVLRHPRVRAEHCDRIVALLKEHESKGIDPYATGVAAEWVRWRMAIGTVERSRRTVPGPDGRPVDKALSREEVAKYVGALFAHDDGVLRPWKVDGSRLGDAAYLRELADWFPRIGLDPARERLAADEITRGMLAVVGASPAERERKYAELRKSHLGNAAPRPLFMMKVLTMGFGSPNLSQLRAMGQTQVRLTMCLAALRRWELTKKAAPKDLAAACKAVGLDSVPLDPYAKAPLRLVEIDGSPAVYSVGKDERDDGGQVDARIDFGVYSEDLVVKLHAGAEHRDAAVDDR